MKKLVKMILLVTLAVAIVFGMMVLTGCGGGGGSSSGGGSGTMAINGTSGNAVNMNGTWTACRRNDADQQDQLISAVFSGNQISVTISLWSAPTTANCLETTQADAIMTQSITAVSGAASTATWTDGSGSTSQPSGISPSAQATAVSMTINSANATVNSASWVSGFNSSSECGKTDWTVGATVSVTNCQDLVGPTSSTDYWVVDDSSSPLKLYMGAGNNIAYQVSSTYPLVK
jgi:hypothetical protein